MINYAHRFHGHASLSFVHRNGAILRAQGLNLKYVNNPKRTTYRAAVIVSKKVHKSAVVRNRIRRRMYEIIRLYADETKSIDFVLQIFDEKTATVAADELLRSIVGLFKKAQIINNNPSV